ncbi:MAG: Eco29kI family restriction endonuclease [Candidatus Obscuribacterales bacterium]|nr:Eco29kI family restriction endonuclease [Candidatus Obscuribacterales bacterium]
MTDCSHHLCWPNTYYKLISNKNKNSSPNELVPVYVGKAVPEGARKGGFGLGIAPGPVLYKRLTEHAKSITQASNLSIDDFKCRYLMVDDIWIPLSESLLVEMFFPIWNKVIDGFGNHDPGSGRYNQQRSPWDVIHPGRPWANKLKQNNRSEMEFLTNLQEFLAGEKVEAISDSKAILEDE